MPGTSALMARYKRGIAAAVVFNTRDRAQQLSVELPPASFNALDSVVTWPAIDLFPNYAATIAAAVEYYNSPLDHYFVTWKPGGNRQTGRPAVGERLGADRQVVQGVHRSPIGIVTGLPLLHSSGTGRLPLLRAGDGGVQRHGAEESRIRAGRRVLHANVSSQGRCVPCAIGACLSRL